MSQSRDRPSWAFRESPMLFSGGPLPETVLSHLGGAGRGAFQIQQFLSPIDRARLSMADQETAQMKKDFDSFEKRKYASRPYTGAFRLFIQKFTARSDANPYEPKPELVNLTAETIFEWKITKSYTGGYVPEAGSTNMPKPMSTKELKGYVNEMMIESDAFYKAFRSLFSKCIEGRYNFASPSAKSKAPVHPLTSTDKKRFMNVLEDFRMARNTQSNFLELHKTYDERYSVTYFVYIEFMGLV